MNNLFLKLIQPSLPESNMQMSKEILKGLKDTAHKHNLLMLLYSQLIRYQKEIEQQKHISHFLDELKPFYLKSVTHSMRQEAIEKEIVFLLSEQGMPSIVIRGNEIAKEIYDDQNCRTSTDIDILIKMSDTLRVDSILSKKGYIRNDVSDLNFWFYRIHHAAYRHPETNDLIEIHWNFGIPSFFKLSSEEIWNEVIATDEGKYKLSPEMLIFMLLIHNHMHFFRELRILVDIMWALHKFEKLINWRMFALKLKRIGLVKTTQITLSQIQNVWGDDVQKIETIPILQKELRNMRYENPILISFFKFNIEKHYEFQDLKDKLMVRFALDDISTIMFSFTKTLFPFPQVIKEFYHDKRNWTLPYNYMRFITWRVKDWTGINRADHSSG
jgi:hypothetical protein